MTIVSMDKRIPAHNSGKLIAKKNYTVTISDTRGVYGSCEKFIKMGNYRQPEVVVEIHSR